VRSTAVIVVGLVALAADVRALPRTIPAFARKYRVSCATCHAPVPRLNAVGEAFAANGFEFAPGKEDRDTIATGDPLLRLQNNLPLAIRYDAYLTTLSKRYGGQVVFDQQTPWVIKLLSGGQVGHKISYYAYFLLSERGEVAGLEDAYIQFTDVGGSGVNVVTGQFQVSDPLFKRELRLPYEDYQPYRVRVGNTAADLTYDRGVMALWSPRNGTDLAIEILNGRGLDPASGDRQYDRDGFKNFAARISQDVGPARVGAFGYYGEERNATGANRIRVVGPDVTLPVGSKAELNVQALRRWDGDPFLGSCTPLTPCPGGATSPFATTVDAAFAELVYQPTGPVGRWHVTALANYVESDRPVVSLRLGEQDTALGFLQRYVTTGVGLHYLLRRNVRLMGESSWDFERDQLRLVTGFSVGF
jgi:hypothetical protein